GELFVLKLVVALEPQALDERRFDDGDDEARTGADNFHILEKTSLVKLLQRGIDCSRRKDPVRRRMEVFADRLRIAASIALHHDRRFGCGGTAKRQNR